MPNDVRYQNCEACLEQPVTKPRALCETNRTERRLEMARQRTLKYRTDDVVRSLRLSPSQTRPILEAVNEVARIRNVLAEQEAVDGIPRGSTFRQFRAATEQLCELIATALNPVAEHVALRGGPDA